MIVKNVFDFDIFVHGVQLKVGETREIQKQDNEIKVLIKNKYLEVLKV